jgi:hypothetical protein
MLEQAGQGSEATLHGRRGRPLLFAHEPLPCDHRAMIDLPELIERGDTECPDEVRHVEPVGAAGARALLAGEPDLLFGDRGKRIEAGGLAGSRREGICRRHRLLFLRRDWTGTLTAGV